MLWQRIYWIIIFEKELILFCLNSVVHDVYHWDVSTSGFVCIDRGYTGFELTVAISRILSFITFLLSELKAPDIYIQLVDLKYKNVDDSVYYVALNHNFDNQTLFLNFKALNRTNTWSFFSKKAWIRIGHLYFLRVYRIMFYQYRQIVPWCFPMSIN